jgi:uncharacterized membrane protein YcjF (UPF0283 family)
VVHHPPRTERAPRALHRDAVPRAMSGAWVAAAVCLATFVVVLALVIPMLIAEWRELLRKR